jgi:hypothetical protein
LSKFIPHLLEAIIGMTSKTWVAFLAYVHEVAEKPMSRQVRDVIPSLASAVCIKRQTECLVTQIRKESDEDVISKTVEAAEGNIRYFPHVHWNSISMLYEIRETRHHLNVQVNSVKLMTWEIFIYEDGSLCIRANPCSGGAPTII